MATRNTANRNSTKRALTEAVAGERSLTARSVLASTLLGTDPPVLPTRRLVRVAELFGVSDNAARVALSRMHTNGEVVSVEVGWALTGHLLERRERLLEGRRADLTPRAWLDGRWTMAVVVVAGRSAGERTALRAAFTRAHYGEYRDGLWTRPNTVPRPELGDLADHVAWWIAEPDEDATELTERLFDVRGWTRRAIDLTRRMDLVAPALAAHDTSALASAFVVSAAVLRHLAADPRLPTQLLPEEWPGETFRASFLSWDRTFQSLLGRWQRTP